jgi:hypothetical protein
MRGIFYNLVSEKRYKDTIKIRNFENKFCNHIENFIEIW